MFNDAAFFKLVDKPSWFETAWGYDYVLDQMHWDMHEAFPADASLAGHDCSRLPIDIWEKRLELFCDALIGYGACWMRSQHVPGADAGLNLLMTQCYMRQHFMDLHEPDRTRIDKPFKSIQLEELDAFEV